jgi:hypothetical protein
LKPINTLIDGTESLREGELKGTPCPNLLSSLRIALHSMDQREYTFLNALYQKFLYMITPLAPSCRTPDPAS